MIITIHRFRSFAHCIEPLMANALPKQKDLHYTQILSNQDVQILSDHAVWWYICRCMKISFTLMIFLPKSSDNEFWREGGRQKTFMTLMGNDILFINFKLSQNVSANLYCSCLSTDLRYTWADAVQICGKFWDTQ